MRPNEHTRRFLAFAFLCCACSASPPTAHAPAPPPIFEERLEEPYLPVRTEFGVILEQPIGTRIATRGQTFSARVHHPVRSPLNEIVLQTGARIRGTVISIENKPALHIKVRFDDIETTWGRAPIAATIRSAEPYATSMGGMDGVRIPYDAALYMPTTEPPSLEAQAAVGGGPTVTWEQPGILLPKGAEIRLILMKPIVSPPGTRSPR
jgi:hypothetical protein